MDAGVPSLSNPSEGQTSENIDACPAKDQMDYKGEISKEAADTESVDIIASDSVRANALKAARPRDQKRLRTPIQNISSQEGAPPLSKRRFGGTRMSEGHTSVNIATTGSQSGEQGFKYARSMEGAGTHLFDTSSSRSALTTSESTIAAPRPRTAPHDRDELEDRSPAKKRMTRLKHAPSLSVVARSLESDSISKGPSWGMVSAQDEGGEMENQAVAISSFLSLDEDDQRCCFPDKTAGHSNLHYFAVYDGHGDSEASQLCKDRLHSIIAEEIQRAVREDQDKCVYPFCFYHFYEEQIQQAIKISLQRMDEEFTGRRREVEDGNARVKTPTGGSTATVVLITTCRIIVANCGDSRVVLSKGGRAIPISYDHTLDRDDEKARIKSLGVPALDVLGSTRAIGHDSMKPWVIPVPEFTRAFRADDDECLIIASHGLWKVLSNDQVCDIARTCQAMGDRPANAAEFIARMAKDNHRGNKENFSESITVVDLMAPEVESGCEFMTEL